MPKPLDQLTALLFAVALIAAAVIVGMVTLENWPPPPTV